MEEDLLYTHIAAGDYHTVLLKSDGAAVARGEKNDGQCDLPALQGGVLYGQAPRKVVTVQFDGDGLVITSMAGEEWGRIHATEHDAVSDVQARLLHALGETVDVVLPSGAVLRNVVGLDRAAPLAQFLG